MDGGSWSWAGFSTDFSLASLSFFLNEISSFFFFYPTSLFADGSLALNLFFPN